MVNARFSTTMILWAAQNGVNCFIIKSTYQTLIIGSGKTQCQIQQMQK